MFVNDKHIGNMCICMGPCHFVIVFTSQNNTVSRIFRPVKNEPYLTRLRWRRSSDPYIMQRGYTAPACIMYIFLQSYKLHCNTFLCIRCNGDRLQCTHQYSITPGFRIDEFDVWDFWEKIRTEHTRSQSKNYRLQRLG